MKLLHPPLLSPARDERRRKSQKHEARSSFSLPLTSLAKREEKKEFPTPPTAYILPSGSSCQRERQEKERKKERIGESSRKVEAHLFDRPSFERSGAI